MNLNFLKATKGPARTAASGAGFTLIELLVVIAIIGLLSSIVLASLSVARSKAADAAIQADISGVRASAELYFGSNNNSYDPFFQGDCPTTAPANTSMFGLAGAFTAPSIYAAIQQAVSLNGIAVGRAADCFSQGSAYAVAAALKTQPDNLYEYFCVDSAGTAKIVTEIVSGRGVVNFVSPSCTPS